MISSHALSPLVVLFKSRSRHMVFFALLILAAAQPAWAEVQGGEPTDSQGWWDRGTALYNDSRIADAEACYREALKYDSRSATTLSKIGACRLLLGDTFAAEGYYRNALRYNPQFVSAWFNFGQVHNLHYKDYEEAERCFRKALELDPNHRNSLRAMLHLLKNTGRPEESAEMERRIIALRGQSASTTPPTPAAASQGARTSGSTSPASSRPAPTARSAPPPSVPPTRRVDNQGATLIADTSVSKIEIGRARPHAERIDTGHLRIGESIACAPYDIIVDTIPSSGIIVSLPIETGAQPAPGETPPLFTPQAWDRKTKTWRDIAGPVSVDDGRIMFALQPEPGLNQPFQRGLNLITTRAVVFRVPTFMRTYYSGRFIIYFFPASSRDDLSTRIARGRFNPLGLVFKDDSVFYDQEWLAKCGSPTGNATKPGVPDYVEDVAVACELVYDRLMQIPGVGDPAFRAPELPMHVYIRNCGQAAGESPLGGPMAISNRNIGGWNDLCLQIAHEMTHVLQGQYYLGGEAGNIANMIVSRNRWFVEATANHMAARACRASGVERRDFYTRDGFSRYLFVSLPDNDDESYYAAGHFLDWCASNHDIVIVPAVLANRGGNDLRDLDIQLRQRGEPEGISGAYRDYTTHVMTNPDKVEGMLEKFKNNAVGASTNLLMNLQGNTPSFRSNFAYLRLERKMPPLSSVYVKFPAQIRNSSLLVADPGRENQFRSGLHWMTYDAVGATTADYEARQPLETARANEMQRPYTVPYYGIGQTHTNFEQMIVNTSTDECPEVAVDYYLLNPPTAALAKNGRVTWSTVDIWNIPPAFIMGYNVYVNGRKLNRQPVPYAPGEQDFEHAEVTPRDDVTVTVVDRHQNEWPEYAGISPPKAKLKPGDSIVFEPEFSLPLNRAPVEVRWRVIGANAGRIEENGRYHAPDRPGVFEIELLNNNNPAQRARARIEVTGDTRREPNAAANPRGPHWLRFEQKYTGSVDANGTMIRDDQEARLRYTENIVSGRFQSSFRESRSSPDHVGAAELTWDPPPERLYAGSTWSGQLRGVVNSYDRGGHLSYMAAPYIYGSIDAELFSPDKGHLVADDVVWVKGLLGAPDQKRFLWPVPSATATHKFLHIMIGGANKPFSGNSVGILYRYKWVP